MPDGSVGFGGEAALGADQRGAGQRRVVLGAVLLVAAACGFLATGQDDATHAVAEAGVALTRLLRGMAAIKAGAALGLGGVVLWRLALPAPGWRLAAYCAAGASMAAGPGLIWDMAHVRLGALLLHAGLFATVVLLWRDPAMAVRLEAWLVRRRKEGVLF